MRVLHVVPSFYPAVQYGGPIYSSLNLCVSLTDLGCEVKVLTTDANGPVRLSFAQQNDPLLERLRIRFCRRVGRGMAAPSLIPHIWREAAWADVIHLTAIYNFSTFPTLFCTRLRDKPLVWSPRGTLQRWAGSRRVASKGVWETLCRWTAPKRAALHITSKQEGVESDSRLGNFPKCLIPNGIEVPSRPPLPPNDGSLKLLFLGRLDAKKGIENLISALSSLTRERALNLSLEIVGDGDRDYGAKLRELATYEGLCESVQFSGHLTGKEKYLALTRCDVVVVPSHTENFGMVVAEALAHARPVIASTGTPWSEVEDRKCGLWVENDPASLAAAILRVSQSDRVAMGERGREWMEREFSWSDKACAMLSLYEELVRSK